MRCEELNGTPYETRPRVRHGKVGRVVSWLVSDAVMLVVNGTPRLWLRDAEASIGGAMVLSANMLSSSQDAVSQNAVSHGA